MNNRRLFLIFINRYDFHQLSLNLLEVKSLKYLTKSDKETIWFGKKLGELLSSGDLIALTGNLGSGKTWFSKGIALGLGVDEDTVITSPSFSLVNEYNGRHLIYHMDLYRLGDMPDLFSAGLEEYFYYDDGVVIMEWAERWPELLPESKIEVSLEIIDEQKRIITIFGRHQRAFDIIKSLEQEAFLR